MQSRERKMYIEILRIIACFCVIFTHTMERGYFLFASFQPENVRYWIYMMFSVFVKSAVPLFFAISGALLICKNEPIKDVYKKRILKVVLVLVIFSFLYYCRSIIYNIKDFSIRYFLNELLISNLNFTFWYLYAFITFLVGLPLLRILAKNMETKHFIYLFSCIILYKAFVPIIEYLIWQGNEGFNSSIRTIWFNADIFVCPVLGYFLEHRVKIDNMKKWMFPLWLINIVSLVVICLITHYKIQLTGECSENKSQTFFSCFSMIHVTTVYLSVKYWLCNRKLSKVLEKIVCSLGKATFGIYLFHLLFLQQLPIVPKIWNVLERIFGRGSMVSALIVCSCVMGMSYVATIIMKKIPIFKSLL